MGRFVGCGGDRGLHVLMVSHSYCRAAFFHGQVEQPVRGLMSLVSHKDIPVLIGINEKGVFIIDHYESVSNTDTDNLCHDTITSHFISCRLFC